MSTKRKLLFSAPFRFLTQEIKKYSDHYEIDFHEIWSESELDSLKLDHDFWIPNPGQNFMINEKVLKKFDNLRIISTPSTGTNHIDNEQCRNYSVKVFGLLDNRLELNKISASAEFTFLKILASIRNLNMAWSEINADRWRENEDLLRGHEIRELSFGFIGMGRIGSNLVRYLNAFKVRKMIYFDPYVDKDGVNLHRVDRLSEVFSDSDVVTVCAILDNKTEGMITSNELRLMKRNSLLVNTSRGELINQNDLIKFLGEREDISFSADVIVGEVINQHLNNPLVDLHKSGRISLTPHIAGATYGSQTQAAVTAFENILLNA